jgi:putative hemolysin
MKKGVELTKLVYCRRKAEWREEQSMRDRQNGSPIDGSIIQPARILLIVAIIAAAAVVGCISQSPGEKVTNETPPMPKQTVVPPAPTVSSTPQLSNPASKYCIEQGYNITIRTNPDGSQTGYCIFPDGRECEEWAYFRGECTP